GRLANEPDIPAEWPEPTLQRHRPARDCQVAVMASAPGGNRTRIEGLGSLRPATRLPALAAAEAGHALSRLSPSRRESRIISFQTECEEPSPVQGRLRPHVLAPVQFGPRTSDIRGSRTRYSGRTFQR